MKKLIFTLCFVIIFVSCSGAGYKSPHEKRNLTVTNTTENSIAVIVKAQYNSTEYFNGTLSKNQTITLPNVPLCTLLPESAYDWRVVKINEHSDTPVWRIRDLTDDEKIKVTVYNYIPVYKNDSVDVKEITLTGKIKNTGMHLFSMKINNVAATSPASAPVQTVIYLYDRDYDFSLQEEKQYKVKENNSGTWSYADPKVLRSALQRNSSDSPPEWVADPGKPEDKNKIPLFFTIDYDKAAKTIIIKPL